MEWYLEIKSNKIKISWDKIIQQKFWKQFLLGT